LCKTSNSLDYENAWKKAKCLPTLVACTSDLI
jgi:hypothetical protein